MRHAFVVFVSICSAFSEFRSEYTVDQLSNRHRGDHESWHLIATLIGHKLAVTDVALKGNLVASSSYDGTVRLWNLQNASQIGILIRGWGYVSSVILKERELFSGGESAEINIWNVNGTFIADIAGPVLSSINGIAIQKYGDVMVTGHDDNTVKMWNTRNQSIITTLEAHESGVKSVAIDGDTLVSGGCDKLVKVWSISKQALLKTLSGHSACVTGVAIQGDTIVSGSVDKTVMLWSASEGVAKTTFHGHTDWVRAVALDGDMVASGSDDQTVMLWNTSIVTSPIATLKHNSSVYGVALDGGVMASCSADKSIQVWSSHTAI